MRPIYGSDWPSHVGGNKSGLRARRDVQPERQVMICPDQADPRRAQHAVGSLDSGFEPEVPLANVRACLPPAVEPGPPDSALSLTCLWGDPYNYPFELLTPEWPGEGDRKSVRPAAESPPRWQTGESTKAAVRTALLQ